VLKIFVEKNNIYLEVLAAEDLPEGEDK